MNIKGFTGRLVAAVAMVAMLGVAMPKPASAEIFLGVSINIGPPALPYYEQPPVPGPGYVWQPGFWAYGPDGYYWVPGTWVEPPQAGFYWTPGYWGFVDGAYTFNPGYWAQNVGYYGGINYGYGYYGNGYCGGRWHGNTFEYNTIVTNVNTRFVRNYYASRVGYVSPQRWNRVDYNGGPHGIAARPTRFEETVARERHITETPAQAAHVNFAAAQRTYRLSYNHGRPGDPAVEHAFSESNRPPAARPGTVDRAAFAAGAVGAAAGVAAAHAYNASHRTTTAIARPNTTQRFVQHGATSAYRAPAATQHFTAPRTTTYHAPVATQRYTAPRTTTYHAPVTTQRYTAPRTTTYHAPVTTQRYTAPVQRAATVTAPRGGAAAASHGAPPPHGGPPPHR